MSELPNGWALTTVGEITLPIATTTPADEPDSEFQYLDISAIDNQTFRVTSPKTYLGKDAPSRARQVVAESDTLFSTVRTYLKNIAFVPKHLDGQVASTGFAVLRPVKFVDPRFLFHYTLTSGFLNLLAELQRGTSYPAVREDDVRSQPFPLPPTAEQRRIVAKVEELFSELDEGVANLKKARAQLAVYRQALLKHAFEGHLTADWRTQHAPELESADQLLARIRAERDRAFETEVEQWKEAAAQWTSSGDGERSPPKPQKLKPTHRAERPAAPAVTPQSWHLFHLDEIVISIGQGWSPKCEGFPAENDHWGVMKTTAIQPLEFRGHENKQLPDGLHPRPWLQILENDILITRAGPRSRCGIVCRVKVSPEKVMLCDKAYRLRVPEAIVSSGYMELLLNSTESSNRIEALKTGINDSGVNITQTGFLNLAFPIPPISEQIAIQRMLAESLSVIDNIEADIDLNLQKAEALRQSILKKAFAGELAPQDPADEPAAALLARIRAEREAAATAKPGKSRKAKKP